MNIILVDGKERSDLLPLCFTRPVSGLRTGILTIREKWEKRLPGTYSWKTESYLQGKYPLKTGKQNLILNAHICPTDALVRLISQLDNGYGIQWKGMMIAAILDEVLLNNFFNGQAEIKWAGFEGELDVIRYPWDLAEMNPKQIQLDFDLLTDRRVTEPLSPTNRLIHAENIFVEPGARLEFVTINASGGPVYIGEGAEIMEGAMIRGPFSLGKHAVVNMGSKIYGGTTVGPHSKLGGEVCQSILTGFSNKGHDGFLGHSVIGEWCNLGAGTNVSNLKNNYEQVKVWNYTSGRFVKTGLQFCGLIMGDHSKAGINTMFNTGTVVGVACNIHGHGFPRQFIPSFADGGAGGFNLHQLQKVFTTAGKVMERRNKHLTETDKQVLSAVFEQTAASRRF